MKLKVYQILSVMLALTLVLYAQSGDPIVKTFTASPGEKLVVNIDPGNIDINTWSKNEVKIEVLSKRDYEVKEMVAEKTGSTIKFYLELDDGWNNSITVKIMAPSSFNFDLETTGGNINIGDDLKGELNADTDGGNVNFENVKGKVLVETSGGNISGENVEGNVNLHTNGGNISLGDVKGGKAEVDTYGGNISVGKVSSDLSAKTHGGNLSIGNVGGNANVFTYGGHISMDKVSGSASMETYGGHISLDGASGKVLAKTMGGHISLEDITGSIEAVTSGGHIAAQFAPALNTSSVLTTAGGHISLEIPPTAKATINVFIENDDVEYQDPKEILKSDYPAQSFDVDKSDGIIKATYVLNGGGSEISLECNGGNVKINKWNK